MISLDWYAAMSDQSESDRSRDESTLTIGQLTDELKASGQKESLFQSNKIREGLELSQFSHGTAGSFGSQLLKNIDKDPGDETPPPHLTALPHNIPMKKAKSGPPVAGYFKIDHVPGIGTGSSSSDLEQREPTRARLGGSLSPGPKGNPTIQRTGSLSPGPISSGRQKMKWSSKESSSRHQPYLLTSRKSPYREKKRSSSIPGDEVPFDTIPKHREFKKKQWEVTERFDMPSHNKLVSSIFSSHPRHSKEIPTLATNFRIQVDKVEDGDHLAVLMEGHPRGVEKATDKLTELVKQIEESIVSEVMSPSVPCAFLPVLASQQLQHNLKAIEKKNRVSLLICKTKNNHLPLNSEQFIQPFAVPSPESLPKLVNFKDYITPEHPVHTKYKWQAEDDSGELQQVPSQVEEYLNECYFSGLPQFSHNGECYRVDVVNDVLFEVNTGVCRKLLKQPRPPVWSYCMGKGLSFIDCKPEDSEKLDDLLHYGGADIKVLSVQKGTVDFTCGRMALVDLGSELAVPLIDLQRSPAISKLPTYGIRLAIKGLRDDIEFAKTELRELLKGIELVERAITLPVVSQEQLYMIRTQLVNNARQYFVELSVKEDKDQVLVIVRGEERYVQNVHFQLRNDTVKLQEHLLSQERRFVESHQFYASSRPGSGSYPVEWQPQKKPCELQAVTPNSIEWNGVLSHMKKTMSNVNLMKLERVQNRALWDKYSLEMAQMKERNGDSGVSEKLLFHGTRKTDPKVIVDSVKGIDFRYSNPDRSLLWGKGAYFAVNASYSDDYCYRSGKDKQMLLVRVLTGNSCRYEYHDPSLTKPPSLPYKKHMLYDTVNGHTNGSLVYVVYDHDRAYPAYLITYR